MSGTNIGLRLARKACGARANMPVEIVAGSAEPEITGHSAYYTTPSGKPVYYPNAYRRAYGKPIYHHSTIAVTVGEDWIAQAIVDADLEATVAAFRREASYIRCAA